MPEEKNAEIGFEGEEAGSGYASPLLDLIATLFLVVLSIGFMAASLRLAVPGNIATAPGLVPFLVSLTLLLMALGLGASAFGRWRSGVAFSWGAETDRATQLRTLFLVMAVAAYIAALQVFAFQQLIQIAGATLRITAFEPVTLVALAATIHGFWRGPVWISVAVSAGWTVFLSLIFQNVFNMPLPGSW